MGHCAAARAVDSKWSPSGMVQLFFKTYHFIDYLIFLQLAHNILFNVMVSTGNHSRFGDTGEAIAIRAGLDPERACGAGGSIAGHLPAF